ncbi:MAG: precorrin-2 C(20)-methyltransferase [Omnitrophica bacterium]|nr:precorrin-2 C(20)-methyltransferase [Candidatus Omnitrophota bacterium]
MCSDHKKVDTRKGKLYGIGIGPGDPGLLTIKAKEILDEVDIIFVPKSEDDGKSCARSIIERALSGKKDFTELTFPMTRNKKTLKAYWKKAAGKIAGEVRGNKNAAFVTIGDPFIFSTYIYLSKTLRQDFPDVDIETIPGISSFNAASSRLELPLVEGNERLAILPVPKDLKGLRATLKSFDTVILMKVASKLDKVIRLLKEVKLIKNSALITHAGHPNEAIIRDLSSIKDKKLGYLSVIIVKRKNRS